MEDTEKTQLEEMLMCTVCHDIFKDPRQLPCGHSMCMGCLENLMDHSSDLPFRCPDCRSFFGQIVEVQKSYALANIAENFRENRRRREEQTKVVYCDCCPEKKTLAIKTCLKCEVSMCKEHVKDHQELPVFTGHPVVRPLGDLQARKCPQHEDEVLRYYCNTSRRYICNMCALERKQHNLASEASTVLRRQLTEYMDQRFTVLKEQITESTDSVRKLKDDIQREKLKVNPADSCLNSVTVVLLCMWFIVLYYAYNYSVENQTLRESLDKQQNRVHHIYSTIAELLVEHPLKSYTPPETEDKGFLMLDVDTVSPFLGVSADFQTVERVKGKLGYPNSFNRFDEAPQILSARCFSSGTHIWEVQAEGYWDIAVSYKSIERKSKYNSAFGNNRESWSLTHNGKGELSAYHNGGKTVLPVTLQSSRIAVMVNFEKGNITFSAVESTITKLHEFKAKLTQPVCLGLGLYRVDPLSRASIVKAF
ncbi:E3 ubiquitin/ISG15 ligase TRIM25-like [Seriola lalandi dorsalis]|uniref:E3 ubiquitin/ISG15 ligase TRIM25-like n=2 Tax=Seriola lalandi dorsalis TaxID=1841481 RepID=A0A3B4WCT3_SERLL|nr:E3 ubiquitin/ISG15 ligase TRIM25-like [Seriola lalandi dorsalis]XP_023277613.1 E3 ubiquitin/ISG15 ligase TRIM25-like [Seriola lalandi dorsalis]